MTGIRLNISSSFLKREMTDATHLLVTSFSIRSYCQAAPLFQSYNFVQGTFGPPLPPILMMPKWPDFAPSLLYHCFGGKRVSCSFLFCPRLWGPLFLLSAYCLLSQSCELLPEVRGDS